MTENKLDRRVRRAFKFLDKLVELPTPGHVRTALEEIRANKPQTAEVVKTLLYEALNRPLRLVVGERPPTGNSETEEPRHTLAKMVEHTHKLRHSKVGEAAEALATDALLSGAHPVMRPALVRVLSSGLGDRVTHEAVNQVWPDLIKQPGSSPAKSVSSSGRFSDLKSCLRATEQSLLVVLKGLDPDGALHVRGREIRSLIGYVHGRVEFLERLIRRGEGS